MEYSPCLGGNVQRIKAAVPVINETFVGSGDLFASTFLAWSHFHPDDMKMVLQKVLSTMRTVLMKTQAAAHGMFPIEIKVVELGR